MEDYFFTDYFEKEVLRKRPYLRRNGVIELLRILSRASSRNLTVSDSGAKYRNLGAEYYE